MMSEGKCTESGDPEARCFSARSKCLPARMHID